MDMTVKGGVRASTANAYLKPALRRQNLTLETNALMNKLTFDGRQCTGVEYQKKGTRRIVKANKEVILSAGAFGSPHILMLSGIGAPSNLRAFDVEVLHELPGVGENLQDHLEIWIQQACVKPITLASAFNPFSRFFIGLQWMLFKTGLGATNHFEACGFIKSQPEILYPDIQFHFLPAAMAYNGSSQVLEHGYQVHVGHNKPKSRGNIRLKSNDPLEKPRLFFNYLDDEKDREGFRACVHLSRKIFSQAAFDSFRGREIAPGPDVCNDDDIDHWVAQNAETAYHPACSCKMGTDNMAVVDPSCRVRGINGLRVVDSSIMPTITNGNLNAPTIMIAEKAADMILDRAPLEAINSPSF